MRRGPTKDQHRIPSSVALTDYKQWSPYGAPWLQPVATSGNRLSAETAGTSQNRCHGLRPLAIGAHGKGRVNATPLVLKRGSLSWLRKEDRVPETRRRELKGDRNSSSACGRWRPST